jgi:hypothetical protein
MMASCMGPSRLRLAEHQLRMFPIILRKLEELESSINAQARELIAQQRKVLTEMQAIDYLELINNQRKELIDEDESFILIKGGGRNLVW